MRKLIFWLFLVLLMFCFVSKNSQYAVSDTKVVITNSDNVKFPAYSDREGNLILFEWKFFTVMDPVEKFFCEIRYNRKHFWSEAIFVPP